MYEYRHLSSIFLLYIVRRIFVYSFISDSTAIDESFIIIRDPIQLVKHCHRCCHVFRTQNYTRCTLLHSKTLPAASQDYLCFGYYLHKKVTVLFFYLRKKILKNSCPCSFLHSCIGIFFDKGPEIVTLNKCIF